MYLGIEKIFCPTAALRRGCPAIGRGISALAALAALDGPLNEDDMVDAALGACDRGCPDTRCGEVDEAGVVCLQPLNYDAAAIKIDLAGLEGGPHE